ncbi:MAG TPA: hypothetical protein VKA21_13215 [Candidatus Binatia bacterium]|nr:hypothetical protein [Candidatus Binatia bacterium]
MRTALHLLLAAALLAPVACAAGRNAGAAAAPTAADWRLAYPPEQPDDRYPKGYHLVRSAPLHEWKAGDAFGSEEQCEAARLDRLNDAIDRARVEHGDGAKNELPVRRAVNARCLRTVELQQQ